MIEDRGAALRSSLQPDGPAAVTIEMAKALAREMTPEQSEVLESLMAVREEDNRWKHAQFRLTGMPAHRQAVLYARVLAALILFDERVLWVTEGRSDAKRHLEALAQVVAPLPGLRVRRAQGEYGITNLTGGWLRIMPGGHAGYSADLVIFEARRDQLGLQDAHLALIKSRSPQLIFDSAGVLLD